MSQVPQPRRSSRIAAIAVLVLAGLGFWSVAIRANVSPKNYGVVDEGRVYRAGQMTPAAMRRIIEKNHIKTVIDLGSYYGGEGPVEKDPAGNRRNQRVADAMGVKRYLMPLYGDGTGNPNRYVQALRIINDPSKQPVLVHCGAGSERTSVTCILYEHMRHGTGFDTGVREARQFRHNPDRNPHVRKMLDTWGMQIIKCVQEGGQITDPAFTPLPEPKPVVWAESGATTAAAAQ
jgi:tyrosine-protein phosphatase SIW14